MHFTNINIDVSEKEVQELIALYIKRNLRPESQSLFLEESSKGTDDLVLAHAVFRAILNESIVDCIEEAILNETIQENK